MLRSRVPLTSREFSLRRTRWRHSKTERKPSVLKLVFADCRAFFALIYVRFLLSSYWDFVVAFALTLSEIRVEIELHKGVGWLSKLYCREKSVGSRAASNPPLPLAVLQPREILLTDRQHETLSRLLLALVLQESGACWHKTICWRADGNRAWSVGWFLSPTQTHFHLDEAVRFRNDT